MIAGLGSQLIELLTPSRLIVVAFLFTFASFIVDFTWKPRYSESLPRVGCGVDFVGTLKNWVLFVTRYDAWFSEGYEKYSKHGRAFVVPGAPAHPQEIVVPRSQAAWMLELPDRVLSTKEAHRDSLHNDYQFFGVDDQFPIQTIHKHLARSIIDIIPGVQEEVQAAIDDVFGKDMDWKTVNLWDAWLGIVPRVTNRIIVGAGLCRNKDFLAAQVAFADDVVRNSILLDLVPSVFKPIVAPPLVALSNYRRWRKSYLLAKSLLEERLTGFERKAAGDPDYLDWQPPEDMVTWLIRQARADGLDHELNPEMLSKRILPVEFAAIHTTVVTGFNLTIDLLSAEPSLDVLGTIREETARVLAEEECPGSWSKQGLMSLHRTDSAIKESMRLSTFARGLTHRKVVAPEGITNATEGWHAPYGASLTLDMAGIHHDPDIYPNPDRYDPWRFSRQREEIDARARDAAERGEKIDPDEAMRAMRLGMVTTSAEYLSFSHGRHACPGRFFVAHELKMILAYLVQNYEFKPLPERPKPVWFGHNQIPPVKTTIEVRRKKSTI
ncbi:hypothetical protein VTJ49DRAFT_1495 [Mycothermus thermophilus]|uniref:Cytochrome P450 n=1 Tax=Humicola insolens TaxID=85995 RepID=A0ABR3VCF2_HUMIN